MYRIRRIGWILGVAAAAAGVFLSLFLVGSLVFHGMKYVFHLDFSQEYQQVNEIEQLRFWDSRSGKVYIRYPFGLRPIEKREDASAKKKSAPSWLDTSIYDVMESGGLAAWYDWEENRICLGNTEGEIQTFFGTLYEVNDLVFSPDGRYLLSYEIAYGGEMTDDETCYYRILDLEKGMWYTVYSGYREWFRVYWEET